MDTQGGFTLPEYAQLLDQQKRTFANAQAVKGQPFQAKESRDGLITRFMLHGMTSKAPPGYSAMQSRVPSVYAPCITSLHDLQKVMITDLTLETHHRGSYVLLRAVTPPNALTAIMLYHQDKELAEDDRLVEGTVMLVKEPYLSVLSDGGYGIRVDHLADVKFLPEHDSLVPNAWRGKGKSLDGSANDWKTKGNESFKKADYHRAVEQYSPHSDLLRNEADHDVRYSKALDSDPTKEEARRFRSIAPSPFSRPPNSMQLYAISNTAAQKELKRALEPLAEQEEGRYQFARLQLEAKTCHPPRLDHATYIDPIAVRAKESHGRGLFTTKAVKAGDLLFCEKAFAYVFHDNEDPHQGRTLSINSQTERMALDTQAEVIRLAVQKLYKNPSLMSTFTDLYHGPYKPVDIQEVDGTPVVDTFLAVHVVSLNCFGCPRSGREAHVRSMKAKTQPVDNDEKLFPAGFGFLASYINHSCLRNAHHSFIGDMEIPRFSMWEYYLSLVMVFRTLESLGYVVEGGRLPHTTGRPLLVKKWGVVVDGLVGCWMGLTIAYRMMGLHDLQHRAENYARVTYEICVGEDETFDETYSKYSARADGFLIKAK